MLPAGNRGLKFLLNGYLHHCNIACIEAETTVRMAALVALPIVGQALHVGVSCIRLLLNNITARCIAIFERLCIAGYNKQAGLE